ncbi:hypothetical protein M419DRAFT_108908 [Trichoderma reesei RUT C-30]|uniref:Uncharacterized protein n=1 Tax=Hypocrea jecorina (strain ATCC 56765 / BCRC 32924 / NRRL 11460 / Rut C-30) TaxID=1344414 RepID=A0A024SD26_HYPJR|nr:hypothetical protein M419DRAFT_108908 [Trichoderma reesei RUT C-30]
MHCQHEYRHVEAKIIDTMTADSRCLLATSIDSRFRHGAGSFSHYPRSRTP